MGAAGRSVICGRSDAPAQAQSDQLGHFQLCAAASGGGLDLGRLLGSALARTLWLDAVRAAITDEHVRGRSDRGRADGDV